MSLMNSFEQVISKAHQQIITGHNYNIDVESTGLGRKRPSGTNFQPITDIGDVEIVA